AQSRDLRLGRPSRRLPCRGREAEHHPAGGVAAHRPAGSRAGVRLFDREPRRVALTPKGNELLPYAERMVQLRADMLQAAREKKAMRGMVRLGVAETIVHT